MSFVTTLESFSVSIPTVLFWNPNHWELWPSSEPYFDELHRPGVLHYEFNAAAEKVNEIYTDPDFVAQVGIQEAKDRLCRQFARI